MDFLRKFFENIKNSISGVFSGGGRGSAGNGSRKPFPSDAELAAQRRRVYASRARGGTRAPLEQPEDEPSLWDSARRAQTEAPGGEEKPLRETPLQDRLALEDTASKAVEDAGKLTDETQKPASGGGIQGYGIDARARAARPHYTAMRRTPGAQGRASSQDGFSAREAVGSAAQRVRGFFLPRKKPPNAILGVALTSMKLLVFAVLALGMAGVGAVVGIAKAYVDTTPVLDTSKIQNQELTSFIYDGNGNLITSFAGMENREWAGIDEIPKNLQHAFVSIEDSRFYQHNGVDYKRIVGAFLSNMSSNSSQGGSTITQQLIKNTMGSTDRTYKRKIQEAWLSVQLEAQYQKKYPNDYKDMILEAYLNTIPLGESDYGVKTAAKDYFGKSLDQLTLRECAMLAGLTQSPYLYDPRLNSYTRHRMDITDKRTNTVLLTMYQQGYIGKDQYESALNEQVTIQQQSTRTQMYDMPYFVEYAIDDITTHLLKARSLEDTPENRSKIDTELRTSGYKIYLTVDPDIQKTVEDTLYNWKKYPKMQLTGDSATKTIDSSGTVTSTPQPQAAAVVLDYHTGQLKAIVGGRQQPTARRTLNRAYQAHMPVGSAIKPIAVYGPAIDLGKSPATIIQNIPAPIAGWGTAKGYPSNFSGDPFTGPISMRQGIIHSYNVVAAHVLLDDVTIDKSVDYLQKLGVKSPVNKDGPGLALGTSGITPVEMSAAYGAFGNEGTYIEPLSFTKIVDQKGAVVLDAEKVRVKTQVFKPSTAWMMVDMMTDVVNKGTGSHAKIPNMVVAGKTGTNSDYRGVSFCALTPYYSSDIWVGSDAYKPLYKGATGGTDAAPIWQSYMAKIVKLKSLQKKAILPDSAQSLGLVQATVCGVSGDLATDACQADTLYPTVTDWFLKGTVPTDQCGLHFPVTLDKTSGKVATPFTPPDETEPGAMLFVPQDSIIRKMAPADIQKYFPNAVLELPSLSPDDLAQFTYDNPTYAKYFDPIHNQDWENAQQQWNTLTGQANTLISDVQANMASYALSQDQTDALNAKIKAIQDIEAKGFSDPAVPAQTVLTNFQNAITDLQTYAATVFAVQPTPTPEPSPSPSPSTGLWWGH